MTGILAWVSRTNYNNNERRLLQLRVKEVAAVLASAQPAIETPLASAAALADETSGNVEKFRSFASSYIGPGQGQFLALSLWKAGAASRGPIAALDGPLELSASPAGAQAFIARAASSPMLSIIGLKPPSLTRLGYAYPTATRRFVVYGERALPANRRSRLQGNSAFSDLDYAVYLGRAAAVGEPAGDERHPPAAPRRAGQDNGPVRKQRSSRSWSPRACRWRAPFHSSCRGSS